MAREEPGFMPWRLYTAAGLLVALAAGYMIYIFTAVSEITGAYVPLVHQAESIGTNVLTLHLWMDETEEGEHIHRIEAVRQKLEQTEQEANRFLTTSQQLRDGAGAGLVRHISHTVAQLQELHRALFRHGFSMSEDVERNSQRFERIFRSAIDDSVNENALLKGAMAGYVSRVHHIQIILILACLVLGLVVVVMSVRLNRRRHEDYLAVVAFEAQLNESRAHLAEAERLARIGNWDWDIVNDYVACSEGGYRIFGIEAEGFDGKLSRFLELMHPDDRQSVRHALDRAMREHVPYRCEYRILPPGGEERIIHAMGEACFDEMNRAVSMFGTVQDVTEERHADARIKRLAAAVEQTAECILISDRDGVIEYVNPAFERVSGYAAEELIGKKPNIIKSGEHPEAYYRAMWHTLLQGKRWAGGFINRRKDGSLYEVEQSISPIQDDEGRITGFSSVQRDVTEQKRQRSQLEHTQRLEALGVLAGGIAHDFNNILTAIMGNASLAEHKIDQGSVAMEHLTRIESAAQRAGELCKQMLAYSGKGRFAPCLLDLSSLVEEMSKLMEVSIAKSVELRLELAERLPAIEADTAQIQQVVMNLVINAAESIGSENGRVTVATGVRAVDRQYLAGSYMDDQLPEGSYVYLEVSDTGCGMDEETRAKIFDPFFTTKFTGRGLGMSAVLGIVRGHQGTIRVYSEPGKGSSFKVLLPCTGDAIVEPVEEKNGIRDWRESGTVLVVDDEGTIRETAAMILEGVGFKVLLAGDGEEGVAIFRKHADEIAIVLLDMTMPKMNGDVAFEKMRGIRPEVPVVLSSGYSESDINPRFEGRGLSGFIQKPYAPIDLKRKIREVLGQ